MFSLLVTIIAIALVALLALATLYYGGSSFQKGGAGAQAAKLLNEGQQLLGASDLYRADKGTWPDSIQTLIAGNYLTAQPGDTVSLLGFEFELPQLGLATARADETVSAAWTMPVAGNPTFLIPQTSSAVCAEVNRKSYGQAGVLTAPRSSLINQCYGAGSPDFTMMVSKEPAGLGDIPVVSPVLSTDPVPTDPDSDQWSVKPGASTSTGTTPTTPATPPVTYDAAIYPGNTEILVISPAAGQQGSYWTYVQNQGDTVLQTPQVSVTAPFSIGENDCTGPLGNYDYCWVEVLYTATKLGAVSGTMTITSANAAPVTVPLTGQMRNEKVYSFDFPITARVDGQDYDSTYTQIYTTLPDGVQTAIGLGQLIKLNVTNESGVDLHKMSYVVSGNHPDGLVMNSDLSTCQVYGDLAAGASCTVILEPQAAAGATGYANWSLLYSATGNDGQWSNYALFQLNLP